MADRTGASVGRRLYLFARSILLLGIAAVGVPWLLVFASRERFGGAAPFHGVPSPVDWDAGRIRSALTDRLTDQTLADVVIRSALVVAWVAVVVLVLTVVVEAVHMLRHDGLALPDVRGLGATQRVARVIAAGLLVVVPLVSAPSTAIARDGPPLLPTRSVVTDVGDPGRAAALHDPSPHATSPSVGAGSDAPGRTAPIAPTADVTRGADEYVVRPGDSIFGIAERLAGPDTTRIAAFAERIVELNMGREMVDGRRFGNAAFIDVGWVLRLPAVEPNAAEPNAAVPTAAEAPGSDTHLVEVGESLWSIADDELGDPSRWPEVFEANAGRTFDDGRTLHDPDLIQPGWELRIPGGSPDPAVDHRDEAPAPELEGAATEPAPADTASNDVVGPTVNDDRPVEPPAHLVDAVDRAGTASADRRLPADGSGSGSGGVAPRIAAIEPAPRDNVWPAAVPSAPRADPPPPPASAPDDEGSDVPAIPLLGSAAMLSAGVLTLLAVRRRRQLRQAPPRSVLPLRGDRTAATERTLRAFDAGERFARVERAIRSAAPDLVRSGERVEAVLVGADGDLELRASGATELPAPWVGAGATWRLSSSTPTELLAPPERAAGMPTPTLVQLGTDDVGRDVYVDLEALEALEVGGPGEHADAVVAALAATLAASTLAEVTTLVGLGVADAAFLGHRRYLPARDHRSAFETAAAAIGSTATMSRTTFDLRTNSAADESWEPAVVLVGAAVGTITLPSSRTGLAVVSAAPVHGPSSRLAPDGDAWTLRPAGIRLTPVGLTPVDLAAVAELVTVPSARPAPQLDRGPLDDEPTIVPGSADAVTVPAAVAVLDAPEQPPPSDPDAGDHGHREPVAHGEGEGPSTDVPTDGEPPVQQVDHDLLVRLLGPVDVVSTDGRSVEFERSKTRELVTWLVTHRDRSTRSSARSALWELDVRDATFSNVVSEARRALARLVEPPEGEEWVGRTMTDALPLHERVVSDADLLRDALDAARVQAPAHAIATLRPAVELVAGLPFEGTAYLWPDAEGLTSNLVLLATSATAELAAHCLSVGDVDGVFAATGRGLRVLPGHEELIALRMEAHARSGDLAGVRQEWESYERVINADPWSDGEPAPKLVELRRRLLHPDR